MTGWRVGFAAGPVEIIKAMAKIQSHSTSGAATFIQHALVEALAGDQSHVEMMRAEFERRGRYMHKRLNAIRGVTCVEPGGAFFCFPNVSGAFKTLGVSGSLEFCNAVLDRIHVAFVPGAAFGADEHVRLSFACGMDQIEQGLDRLTKLLGTQ